MTIITVIGLNVKLAHPNDTFSLAYDILTKLSLASKLIAVKLQIKLVDLTIRREVND